MKHIPNIFTLLNLFFGCMAIVFALQTESIIINVDQDYNTSIQIPEKLVLAAICIGIAGLVDFLDGFVARLFNATSEIGRQLDSLSDVVSFGVAPGMILYQLLRLSYAREANGLEVSLYWLMPAFILSCSAAFRLAKFNMDNNQQYNFKGVPTPAIGLLVASFPLIIFFRTQLFGFPAYEVFSNKWVLYGLIVILSYLMLGSFKIIGLKFTDFKIKSNIPKIILLVVAIISAILLSWFAVPVVFMCYLILSLIYQNKFA